MTELAPQEVEAEISRLAALRMQLLEMHPFWGYILLQMHLTASFSVPTLATDCVNSIWFNPGFTRTLDSRELGFVLAHEVCHTVLETNSRRGNRNFLKWNMATDFAINDLVSGITVPGASVSRYCDEAAYLYRRPAGVLWKRSYHGMIAETIYEDLCRREDDFSGDSYVDVKLRGADGTEVEFSHVPWGGGNRDLHLPLDLNEDQRDILKERIAAAVENYRNNDSRGDIPGDLLRRIGILDRPKIPWRRVLHHYADTILHQDDYSLAYPNKHFMAHDLIVPGHYNEKLGHLVVALDTSGSMSNDTIRAVLTELLGMVDSSQEITLIVADCRIRRVVAGEELESFIAEGSFPGGGGTDHVCVFDYIREHRLNPCVFVGLTDLYSGFPPRRPPYPVLWLTPEHHGDAPWGKVIELPKEARASGN